MPESTAFVAVEDLDATDTLAAVEAAVRDRRALEVHELELALHWADLHGADPSDAAWVDVEGGPRLVKLGGAGTPEVVDLALAELAIAREQHTLAVRALVADGLDLRHRVRELYQAFREGRVDLWAARRVASMTRNLDLAGAALVDRAVTAAVDEGPGRMLAIAEAKVIEADTETAKSEREAGRRRRYVALTPTNELGLRTVIAPMVPADAVWLDAVLDRVADALDQRRDLIPDVAEDTTRDELRSVALGWLAHPEDVTALLGGEEQPRGNCAETRKAVVHLHLHQQTVEDGDGVVRVEELGPMLLEELTALLGHARVTLVPVMDLAKTVSINGYEHPESVKDRTHLRTVGDVFPHARTISRKVDMDHPDPYEPHGPPGQTGDTNAAPLGRRHHRAKTHLDYRSQQLGLGRYLWRTPHALHRLVDHTGTHKLDPIAAFHLAHPGALESALDQV